MANFGPFEKVYVENEWYDGPRAGVASINGVPHRFKSLFDEAVDERLGTFLVWPVDLETLKLEQEQWQVFVEWNVLYESGQATPESHPGHGGISARWDELEESLKQSRSDVPGEAKRAKAELEHIESDQRYPPDGPTYKFRWRFL